MIGRGEDCDLRLQNRFVSRHHCELIVDDRDQVLRVRDLGSQNGTFVNDGPVKMRNANSRTATGW